MTLPAPIHYWKLDDLGGIVVDSVGLTRGTYAGTKSVAGAVGTAISISKSTDSITIPQNAATLNTPTELTAGIWWKPTFKTNLQYLLYKRDVFEIYFDQGSFKVRLRGDAWRTFTVPVDGSGGQLDTQTWYHIVAVYNAFDDPQVRIFVNGAKHSFDLEDGPLKTSIYALNIGAYGSTVTYGSFDDAFVAQSAFSDSEVLELYNGGAGKSVSDCITCTPSAHWKLDDRPENGAKDSIGTAHAALVGYLTPDPAGQVGEGAAFIGRATEYLTIPNDASQQFQGALTVACWYKPATFMLNGAVRESFVFKGPSGANGFNLGFGVDTDIRSNGKGPTFTVQGASVFDAATNFQAGTWYHLVGTYDGDKLRIYLDGVKRGEADGPTTPITGWAGEMLIGQQLPYLFQYPANGTIDDVLMYDVVLSDAEVAELHARGLAGQAAH